jgi:hypothetical protein
MSLSERRHAERTAMARVAYIHIEPDNGGIVLNVSGEGLCFHSMAPVERNGPFRFSLSEQNRRIDACGDLAWTDEIQKIGGLRFTTLSAEAREQIQNWISHPVVPIEEHKGSTLRYAALKSFAGLDTLRFDRKTNSSDSSGIAAALLNITARMKLSGFSGGLATGLLVSVLAASVFFAYAYRGQLGESLIHLGERLAAKPKAEMQTALPALEAGSPKKGNVSPIRTQTADRAQIPAERLQGPRAQLQIDPGKAVRVTANRQVSAVSTSRPADGPVAQHSGTWGTAETAPPIPPPVLLAGPSLPISDKPGMQPQLEFASAVQVRDSSEETAFLPSMYFDLGRFKDQLWAQNIRDQVAKLGLHSSVVQRGHLWMNSYQVLVGPYSNEEEAKRIHKDLVAQGYKARPFERGSRDFIFGSALTVNGARLPVGDFTISWESYVTEANVKFAQGNSVLAKAAGHWIKRPWRYQRNEFVYVKIGNGSRILVEIHFSGLNRALVFGNSS